MRLFAVFIAFIIFQRVAELIIARKNEKRMKREGALEFGQGHYPWMVLMHAGFFLALILEVWLLGKGLSPLWPILLAAFILAQAGRLWALSTLGKYWNTKIIVLPGANPVRKGPYRFIRHPNYVIVTLELLVVPLLFEAYMTASVFAVLNAIMLSVRIPAEEKALSKLAEYEQMNQGTNRFIPQMLKKIDK
ncbi:isoprenylcysteine carboxyl methyltransferase family protein [Bacillus sp. FJAT-27245]|uniref:isoprenylcysteine carboxyl methyltransferase family protein n=1 Tax=Bacillus sp. FJAT-27245 TaxID=1684144 RepID=UPI0006A7B05D|nr:isoprenylcysteine carboxylmethyltransferase family protein [Bacillus sp. FJAT-27245]